VSDWELVFYQTASGRCPVVDFLGGLSAQETAAVTKELDLLEEFGIALGPPHTRFIRGKLWELRCRGRSQHRVFYVAVTGRRLVLLHAFTKKTQQTPPQEIETAQQRLRDYEQRGQP
jgi:phage-related protein